MSQAHLFPHQAYRDTPPTTPHYFLQPNSGAEVGSAEFQSCMGELGATLRRANVAAIYLAHGTFVGPDAFGILGELSRVLPGASGAMRRLVRRVVNHVTGEAGNYSPSFARVFQSSINAAAEPSIPVRVFEWSSENHHLGRADGAVRLIDELASLELQPGQRVLLWGHSHAGNVFALTSNLLAGSREAVEHFFRATEIYWRWPLLGCVDIPVWNRVRRLLLSGKQKPDGRALDFVTFGTPVRYGWNADGMGNLLHFINHRTSEGCPEYRAPFPPKLQRVLAAADGDYVQQLGIAGTDLLPSWLSWRAWMAHQRLNRLFEETDEGMGPLERFRAGTIVPDAGTTLLVDYGLPHGNITRHLAGHAVYTRKKWMLFHADETRRRFYGDA
jgi:hypothetical protein